ncbi:MAG: hypothetical protein KGJ02_07760 [Verrucomicrobiota bacterium]|nr:hypothetical protein [Verrucomicrobiota bacterium]
MTLLNEIQVEGQNENFIQENMNHWIQASRENNWIFESAWIGKDNTRHFRAFNVNVLNSCDVDIGIVIRQERETEKPKITIIYADRIVHTHYLETQIQNEAERVVRVAREFI